VLMGWSVAVGLSTLLIILYAKHGQTMDRLMPFLIVPVWIVSFAFLSVGTFRTTRFVNNAISRFLITAAAVFFQCSAYWLVLTIGSAYVHFGAGGNM